MRATILSLGALAIAGLTQAQNPHPNVLFITADDLNCSSPGCFGGKVPDITPNIDAMASQGLRFAYAYVNVAVSQPSRGVMLSGMYSHANGVEGFYESPYQIPTLISVMNRAGYATAVAGKVSHCSPRGEKEWGTIFQTSQLKSGRDPESYAEALRSVVRGARSTGKPFFMMANSHDSHRPFHGSEKSNANQKTAGFPDPSRIYKPGEVEIPGFLPDLPAVRQEMAQYFSSVRRLDDMVGAVLKVLDEEGVAENTIVMFLSDNGISQPFAKTNCYLNSNRTPWIVRYPGTVKPGTVDEIHMVSCVDFMPTILDACGIAIPATVQGRSFLPVLRGGKQSGREQVFCQFYETSGKRRFPMFTVQDKDFGYVFNAWPDGVAEFRAEPLNGMAFKAMELAAVTDPAIRARVDLLLHRIPEEFYDLKNDPSALNNLVADPRYREKIETYRQSLLGWMEKYDPEAATAFKNRKDPAAISAYMEAQKKIGDSHKGLKSSDE